MVTVRKFYQAQVAGPAGMPGVKSVGLTLEDETGWRHEQIVSIEAGSDDHEMAQLNRAVENLIDTHGRGTAWQWT